MRVLLPVCSFNLNPRRAEACVFASSLRDVMKNSSSALWPLGSGEGSAHSEYQLWGQILLWGQPSAWLLTASSFSRYVYIPVGGSQHGLLGTLFSTAMTFAFVSYWHGGYDYLWCWAALNWLGVTVENGVRRLVETPCIQDSLVSRNLARVVGDT